MTQPCGIYRRRAPQLVFSQAFCYAWPMKRSSKPVRQCHACLLNLGKVCWVYAQPRRQWRNRRCPGFENPALYNELTEWQAAPHVKTRKQLRQAAGRQKNQPPAWRRHTQHKIGSG